MRVVFRVHGRVQGVGYRNHALRHAHILGLAGWVHNEPDGTVSGEVEGEEPHMAAFRGVLAQGSYSGRVTRLDWNPKEGGECLPTPFVIR